MARRGSVAELQAVISGLASRYPKAFSVDPKNIRPLKTDIINDLMADLQTPGISRDLRRALAFYQRSFPYLYAMVFQMRRRDLAGDRVEMITVLDRRMARAELRRREEWSGLMRARYKQQDWIDD